MKCRDFEKYLCESEHNPLGPGLRLEFYEHKENCKRCNSLYKYLNDFDGVINTIKNQEPPFGYYEKIRNRTDKKPVVKFHAYSIAATVAIIMGLGIGFGYYSYKASDNKMYITEMEELTSGYNLDIETIITE